MRLAGLSPLFALSLGGHLVLAAVLGAIPARHRRETVAISFRDTTKAKPPAPAETAHEPEPPPPRSTPQVRAKSATPAKAAPPAANAQPSSMDSLPDFGLSLSGGGPGGVAVPAGGRPATESPGPAIARTLSRSVPRGDDCTDPPAKPKPLSLPTPAYTAQARAAGIAGKVRVEISVDEHGRVVSVRLVQGLGYGLDEAALAAARSMTFAPAIRCGKPSAATFKIGINFAPP